MGVDIIRFRASEIFFCFKLKNSEIKIRESIDSQNLKSKKKNHSYAKNILNLAWNEKNSSICGRQTEFRWGNLSVIHTFAMLVRRLAWKRRLHWNFPNCLFQLREHANERMKRNWFETDGMHTESTIFYTSGQRV